MSSRAVLWRPTLADRRREPAAAAVVARQQAAARAIDDIAGGKPAMIAPCELKARSAWRRRRARRHRRRGPRAGGPRRRPPRRTERTPQPARGRVGRQGAARRRCVRAAKRSQTVADLVGPEALEPGQRLVETREIVVRDAADRVDRLAVLVVQ